MSKLNVFLPKYDFSEKHTTLIKATPEEAYKALQNIDFTKSFVIRLLFWLRGLKSHSYHMIKNHFTVLYDEPSKEIILGVIGQPWILKKEILKCSKEDFLRFNEPHYVKAVWNFDFQRQGKETLITTETRIYCTDEASRKKFKIYWTFVRPFSGLVRIKILKLIRNSL